ncbi:MAG: hypothetical protein IJR07_05895 [Bacteroidaceae bacterium]|nr:hypothetical protein [Bacteroidaceae bacterium]
MELIDYTNKWVSGEIMEDFAMIVGGVACLVLVLVAWRWGTSESARAIILPLTVVAVILVALGGSLAYSNHTRRAQFVEQYQESPEKFLESEKARVADFMKIYPQTIIVSAIMMVVAICVFAFCDKPWLRASALALILIALAALTIDFFSKERGVIYQQELNSFQTEQVE